MLLHTIFVLKEITMEKITKFLINIVKKSAKLITDNLEVTAKGTLGDLVTNFDFSVEKYLIEKISKTYPDFDIISEETSSDKKLSANCFTIDPIDGTVNFANGIPMWSIQVACIKDNQTISAVMLFPKLNQLFYADKSGAFCNGKRISVSHASIENSIVTTCNSLTLPSFIPNIVSSKVCPHIRATGCGSYNYATLASGASIASIIMVKTPWDYVPGEYLVQQAGGRWFCKSQQTHFCKHQRNTRHT